MGLMHSIARKVKSNMLRKINKNYFEKLDVSQRVKQKCHCVKMSKSGEKFFILVKQHEAT